MGLPNILSEEMSSRWKKQNVQGHKSGKYAQVVLRELAEDIVGSPGTTEEGARRGNNSPFHSNILQSCECLGTVSEVMSVPACKCTLIYLNKWALAVPPLWQLLLH